MPRKLNATTAIMIAIGFIFLIEMAVARGGVMSIPASVLAQLGGNAPTLTRGDSEYWRLVSAVYLHGGLLHVAFNAYALFIIGTAVEAALGSGWLLTAFVASGVSGSVASAMANPSNAVAIGASGGIFGLIAMAAALTWLLPTEARFPRNVLIQWILFGLVIGFVAGFDNWGHVGGIAGGVAVALAYSTLKGKRQLREKVGKVAGAVAVLVSVVGLLAAGVSFRRDQRQNDAQVQTEPTERASGSGARG